MSIATRINAIEEHIGNAYDKLDDLGIDLTNIDKNINNIASLLDTVYQEYPKVTGTGTEVTLDGTKVGKLGLDVKGNSTQNGTPAPDNEVPILSAGDNGSISEKIVNKNWLDISKCVMGANNTPVNSNVSFSTKTNRACTKYDVNPILCKPSTSYIVAFNTFYFSVAQLDINNKVLSDSGWKSANYTFTTNANARKIVMNFKKSDDSNFTIEEFKNAMIQVELGSTATTYVAHQEQTYIIPVQQPMRSIGDVRDEFIKVNGEWKERHNIKSKIANENNNWVVHLNGTNSFELNNFIEVNYATNVIQIISNYFKGIKQDDRVIGGNNTIYPISNTKFVIRNTSFASLEDFKTWLSTHNLEVICELATPVDLPCTSEQIAILENLPKSYNEQTNIYSLDVTPAYIEAKALKGE